MKIPVLSTCHIKLDTLKHLAVIVPDHLAKYPEGALVKLGALTEADCSQRAELGTLKEWFSRQYPHEMWLRVDQDGEEIEGLPTFDW